MKADSKKRYSNQVFDSGIETLKDFVRARRHSLLANRELWLLPPETLAVDTTIVRQGTGQNLAITAQVSNSVPVSSVALYLAEGLRFVYNGTMIWLVDTNWKGTGMSNRWVALWIFVSISVAPAARGSQSADPDPNRFAKDIDAFEQWDSKNAFPAASVLFVGSSSIRMWRTREGFPDLPVINRGFGGSHISDVLHFADRIVLPYRPKVIVFYAGDNDVAGRKSAERVRDDYRRFVNLINNRLPQTRLIFVTIKPSGQRWTLWPEMNRANALICDLCKADDRLFFADLATPLLDSEGKPDDDLFLGDRLHLSPNGYAVWNETLRPILSQVLSRSSEKR